ncbi:hypothetical protein FBU59_001646, partial [Linderina macrospora]
MRITSSLVLLAVAALSQSSVQAVSADLQDVLHKIAKYPDGTAVRPGAFIVELDGEPGSANVQAIANSAASSFAKTTPKFKVDKQYSALFNGFSVKTAKDFDPIQLASLPGVKRVWPVRILTQPYQQSSANITYPYLHHATGVDAVVQNLGFTGKGVKIGIVDSGVDFNHPEL